VAAALVTFVVLVYAIVDWRGKRAWEAYKSEWASKGGLPEFASFIPPRVPDEQNFAMTPFLAPLFDFNPLPLQPGQSRWRDTNGQNRAMTQFSRVMSAGSSQAPVLWRQERATDLADWLRSWRLKAKSPGNNTNDLDKAAAQDRKAVASAVLSELGPFRPILDELREASQRPSSRFNIRYDETNPWEILLPHLAVINGASRALQVRASAELIEGNTQAASEDVDLICRLSGTIKEEPFVISHLVRFVMIERAVQAIWEGLESRQWTDAQLQTFQAQLAQLTVLRDFQMPLNAERAADNLTFDLLRAQRDRTRLFGALSGAGDGQASFFVLAPRGWIYQEQVVCNRLFDRFMMSGFEPASQEVKPSVIEANAAALNRTFQGKPLRLVWNHLVMARMLLPEIGKSFQKSALAQNAIDEADVACALERYRIANGRYPDRLEALQPRFIQSLPHDVCTGQPLKYRVTDAGRFVLYSAGWNGQDDGGVFALKNHGSATNENRRVTASAGADSTKVEPLDPDQGDWVWEYPPN